MKQLYKSNTNKKVAGVCGGIGEYFGIDPTIVRLGFVALSLLAGGGLAVYIIAAIIMPDREGCSSAAENTVTLYSGEITNFNSAMYAGGLIVGPEFVANGNTMYKCQNAIGNAPFARFGAFANQPNKPSSCYSRFDNLQLGAAAPYSWDYKWILANKMLNTTLFNLPNPVQKTSSQSMMVEYTLQEVGEES